MKKEELPKRKVQPASMKAGMDKGKHPKAGHHAGPKPPKPRTPKRRRTY